MNEKRMRTPVNTGEVSLLPILGAGWEVKIGAEQAAFTEKPRFGTAKWFDIPCRGEKIVKNGPQQFIEL
jgi:hypothetical protein